jgi:carbamoyltransferase
MKNGNILAAIQEERLQYKKNYSGFPTQAINWVLEYSNVRLTEIDCFAFNGEHMPGVGAINGGSRDDILEEYKNAGSSKVKFKRIIKSLGGDKFYTSLRKRQRLDNLIKIGGDVSKVRFVNHHICHASAAYYGWGNYSDDILILTCDGAGDRVCATISKGSNGHIQFIDSVAESESVCNIYAVITYLMGMIPLEHEYKIMGMAPYVSKNKCRAIADMFWRHFQFDTRNPVKWKRTNGFPPTYYSISFLKKMLECVRFDYVMGGLQLFFEELMVQWVKNCIKSTGLTRLALSGGAFMNVKTNKLIMELDEVEDLFVYPSCGDETNAMGACYYVYSQARNFKDIEPLKQFYFGPDFNDEEILAAIKDYDFNDIKIEYKKLEDIDNIVAKILNQNEVVARFHGREEFGARALGNRSILANPSNNNAIREINDMIKNRDFWMPFATSILKEFSHDYIINPRNIPSPYMILSFDTTDKDDEIVAGIHPYDRTIRPQIVSPEFNQGYYNLIKEFHRITGIAGVLNTSFNLHGFPIVHTPKYSLTVFQESGLKYLAIGSYLIEKT